MNTKIIAFYNEYVANGSNISETAKANGITNTECYQIVQMGKRLSAVK